MLVNIQKKISSQQGQETEQVRLVSAVPQCLFLSFQAMLRCRSCVQCMGNSLTWRASSEQGQLMEGGRSEVLAMLCGRKLEVWIKELSLGPSVEN